LRLRGSPIFNVKTKVPTQLIIPRNIIHQIIKFAYEKFPIETCGVLLGHMKRDIIQVSKIKELKNIIGSSTHFWFDTKEWMAAVIEGRRKGLEYIGIYHVHNRQEPKPSLQDMERMIECPGEVWLILVLDDEKVKIAAWTIVGYDLLTHRIMVRVI